jgi:hypothetical protein
MLKSTGIGRIGTGLSGKVALEAWQAGQLLEGQAQATGRALGAQAEVPRTGVA